MPGGDRTGPLGQGPMTGRGAGYCAGADAPGFMNAGMGRGMGRGFGPGRGRGFTGAWGQGRGRGRRRRAFWSEGPGYYPAADEAQTARDEIAELRQRIELLDQRLSELSGKSPGQTQR